MKSLSPKLYQVDDTPVKYKIYITGNTTYHNMEDN